MGRGRPASGARGGGERKEIEERENG